MFFSKKTKLPKKSSTPMPLPSNWPSRLHNKCNSLACSYPNRPQVAEGVYNCQGVVNQGIPCSGTYYVSFAAATAAMEQYHRDLRREADAQHRAARQEEIDRAELLRHEQLEEAVQQAATEMANIRDAERRQKVHNGHVVTQPHHSLERRGAQRQRHKLNQVPPDSFTYYPRPKVIPPSQVLNRSRPILHIDQPRGYKEHISVQVTHHGHHSSPTQVPTGLSAYRHREKIQQPYGPPISTDSTFPTATAAYENYLRRRIYLISTHTYPI